MVNDLKQVKEFVEERKNLHENQCQNSFSRGEDMDVPDAKRMEADKILDKIEEVGCGDV